MSSGSEYKASSDEDQEDEDSEEEILKKPKKQLSGIRKRRWTPKETKVFAEIFKENINKKTMPNKTVMNKASRIITTRTISQIRTRINNVILGKQTL